MGGWFRGYSYRCQPVDYSHNEMSIRVRGSPPSPHFPIGFSMRTLITLTESLAVTLKIVNKHLLPLPSSLDLDVLFYMHVELILTGGRVLMDCQTRKLLQLFLGNQRLFCAINSFPGICSSSTTFASFLCIIYGRGYLFDKGRRSMLAVAISVLWSKLVLVDGYVQMNSCKESQEFIRIKLGECWEMWIIEHSSRWAVECMTSEMIHRLNSDQHYWVFIKVAQCMCVFLGRCIYCHSWNFLGSEFLSSPFSVQLLKRIKEWNT